MIEAVIPPNRRRRANIRVSSSSSSPVVAATWFISASRVSGSVGGWSAGGGLGDLLRGVADLGDQPVVHGEQPVKLTTEVGLRSRGRDAAR
jgi:hypothetical protein